MNIRHCFPAQLLSDETAFVTGTGSGIDLGFACNFAALGARVAISGRAQGKPGHS